MLQKMSPRGISGDVVVLLTLRRRLPACRQAGAQFLGSSEKFLGSSEKQNFPHTY
jgi:hypothetical protein